MNSPFRVRVCHDSSSKNSWLCEVSTNKTLKTFTQPIHQGAGMAKLKVSVPICEIYLETLLCSAQK